MLRLGKEALAEGHFIFLCAYSAWAKDCCFIGLVVSTGESYLEFPEFHAPFMELICLALGNVKRSRSKKTAQRQQNGKPSYKSAVCYCKFDSRPYDSLELTDNLIDTFSGNFAVRKQFICFFYTLNGQHRNIVVNAYQHS